MIEERLEKMVHSTKIFLSGVGIGFGWGAVTGALTGILIGVLAAPKTGKEMRKDLKEKAEDFMESGKEVFESKKASILESVGKKTTIGYEKIDEALKEKIKKDEEVNKEI
ncbi:YtxH domain-containing protein [Candidatus Oleimmundimicrobium sp.]|uniref:YtxH domain-containing protein n=1 Tax=Candidatus Oleimmundimicrobium sp. TaxID=3060597 RepID=UPI00271E506C|nr:YtxH domain-containing protein [Candidatus Oleimmundimicrobium sp.]MDO8886646.1 YtxH domain-containing protein [Candidatus Oleimmundimicrobium sp.]